MIEWLFGPLVELETRRALARPWLIWMRVLAALPAVFVTLMIVWIIWIQRHFEADISPGPVVRVGFCMLELMIVTGALVIGPALVSSTLAGAKNRGMVTLLLAGNVSAKDVVWARLSGGLTLAVVLMVGSLPPIFACCAWCGLSLGASLLALLLPLAALLGAGGLALALSAVAHRGRDALLTSYVLFLLLMLGLPILTNFLPDAWTNWGVETNLFRAGSRLTLKSDPLPALQAILSWSVLAVAAVSYAAWRIRPAYIAAGAVSGRRLRAGAKRPARPVGRWPMLWKELHCEQQAYGTRIGGVVARLTFAAIFCVTLITAAVVVGSETLWPDPIRAAEARDFLTTLVRYLTYPLSWLIEWWLGIRAATGIIAERERDTWDPLLLSPLEAGEIVAGKLLGSLYAMRWLLLVTAAIWIIPTLVGAMTTSELFQRTAITFSAGAFMAAVGVYCSLVTRSTGVATALAMALWCAVAMTTAIFSLFATALAAMLLSLAWATIQSYFGDSPSSHSAWPSGFISFEMGFTLLRSVGYLLATLLVTILSGKTFDRLAGRSVGSKRYRPVSIPPPRPLSV